MEEGFNQLGLQGYKYGEFLFDFDKYVVINLNFFKIDFCLMNYINLRSMLNFFFKYMCCYFFLVLRGQLVQVQ